MKTKYTFYLGRCLLTSIFLAASFNAFSQINVFPHLETFGNAGCTLPTGWTNTGSDPWDFQNTNETYMQGTDHTTGSGCFASMDDSGGAADDTCLLTSPTIDLSSLPHAQLRFWWQNSNAGSSAPAATGPRPWSNLYVDVSTDGGTNWTRDVWAVEDSQQIGWTEGIMNLANFATANTVLRFRGLETQYFTSDLSLDDILIFEPDQYNSAVTAILSPVNGGCEDPFGNVSVKITNLGWDTITSISFSYIYDGGTTVTETPVVNIPPVSDFVYTFNQSVAVMTGSTHSIQVWTDVTGDTDLANDTMSVGAIDVIPSESSFPYVQDFEAGQGNWEIGGSVTTWAFGTPAKPVINGASSGINCFVTGGLTGQYTTNENSMVTSPCFNLSNFEGTPWVGLDVWWNSEFSWDGAVLQYSVDQGISWSNVGEFGDPDFWYNDNSINGNPGGQQEGWSGRNSSSNGSGGWVTAKHALPESLAGNPYVMMRVAFGSDGSIQDDGFAFDNFILMDFKEAELGPDLISFCGEAQKTLDPGVIPPGKIEWSTGDTSSYSINVNTADVYIFTYTDSLLGIMTSDTIEIVQTAAPVINFTPYQDTVNVNSSVTLDPNLSPDLNFVWTPGDFNFPYLLIKGSDYGLGPHAFNLHVEDSVHCEDSETAVIVFVDITGIEGVAQGQLTVYPNPVEEILTIGMKDINADQVALINMAGQQVYSKPVKNQSTLTIDMKDYESGMYVLVLQVGDERIVQQIIKK